MPNARVSQGVLNRLIASVIIPAFPDLNVTAPFVGQSGIRLSFDGQTSLGIPTMTGVTQSPEPYLMATITMGLLRSQGLAELYRQQIEDTVLIGSVTARPDVTTLTPYTLENCSISTQPEVQMDGRDPIFPVTIVGTYFINNALWLAS